MNVLIGYDGSESSRDAVLDLHAAGLPPDSNAEIVSVADVWPRLPAESFEPTDPRAGWQQSPIVRKARALAELAIAEVRALAEQGEELVKATFPGWTGHTPRTPARPTMCSSAPTAGPTWSSSGRGGDRPLGG
jgi:hypothetical protein